MIKTPVIQLNRSTNQLSTIFYFILQPYSTQSPDCTGLTLELSFFYSYALSFFAGSKKSTTFRFLIQPKVPDPDPQYRYCLQQSFCNGKLFLKNCVTTIAEYDLSEACNDLSKAAIPWNHNFHQIGLPFLLTCNHLFVCVDATVEKVKLTTVGCIILISTKLWFYGC